MEDLLKDYIEEHIQDIEKGDFYDLFRSPLSEGLADALTAAGIDFLHASVYTPPYCFYNSSITELTIPSHIHTLSMCTFKRCENLVKCVLPHNLKTIEDLCFVHCSSLEELNIPDTVISIGVGAFIDCSSLKQVTLPSNIAVIPDSCFGSCDNLTSLTIPTSVKQIGTECFSNASNLKSLKYLGTKQQFKDIVKDRYWRRYSAIKTVTCSDGVLRYK